MCAEETLTRLPFVGMVPVSRPPEQSGTAVGYYRSRLFTASFSTNRLVSITVSLLSLLERLSLTEELPPIETLREHIAHELKACRSQLVMTDDMDAMAYYVLCATADELLAKSEMRFSKQPTPFQAFTPCSIDGVGPDIRVFEWIANIKERPTIYLDLLELIYHCLIAGFEGHYREQVSGRVELEKCIETLYQIVESHRIHATPYLFKETRAVSRHSRSYKSLWLIVCLSGGLLIFACGLSHIMLEKQAHAVHRDIAATLSDD